MSHFRPHRRVDSTPSSPQLSHQPSPSTTGNPAASRSPGFNSTLPVSQDSYTSLQPPILPPIARVTSQNRTLKHDIDEHKYDDAHATNKKRPNSSTALSSSCSADVSYVLPPIQRVTSEHEQDSPDTPTPISATHDILEEKRKLSEPNLGLHPERLSATMSKTRASFADFGRTQTAPTLIQSSQQSKPPTTPSSSTQSHHEQPLLNPPTHNVSSPASSISSFHKAASSTNLAVDSSPASSKSAQGSIEKPSTPGHRLSRGRFNLLNPVSLLKRRRTSQVLEVPTQTPMIPTKSMDLPVMRLPADYDPRIKGKGLHNFDDGPQPKRNYSTNDMPGMATESRQNVDDAKRRSSIPALRDASTEKSQFLLQEKEHTPVFVENFEDEEGGRFDDVSAVQRESLANSQFIARMSKQLDFDTLELSSPFAPRKTTVDSMMTATAPSSASKGQSPISTQQLPHSQPLQNVRNSRNTDNSSIRISSDQSTARSSISNETKATSPPQSPPPSQRHQQTRSLDAPFQPSPNLSHLPSTASRISRFSFQLNSDRSIEQEKALEEKHKRKHESQCSIRDSRFDDFDEQGIDYDDMLDDGGIEEDIPTTGEIDDVNTIAPGLGDKRLSSFNTSGANPVIDVTRASSNSHYTDRSSEDIGPGLSSDGRSLAQGLGLQNAGFVSPELDTAYTHSSDFGDIYFDDGIIEASASGGDSGTFDESALDSPVQSRLGSEPNGEEFPTPKRPPAAFDQNSQQASSPSMRSVEVEADDSVGWNEERTPTKPVAARRFEPEQQQYTLAPESGLNAYHNALAEAASQAARDGKFSRQNSVMTASSVYSSDPPIRDVSRNDGRYGQDGLTPGSRQAFDDYDDEDDVIVAEANADALASEDFEFYGQEFGFFRNPNATGDGQLYNGGYFGQPNLLGASLRQREPNLTPITERSEYSTRNSIIGSTPWGPASSTSQAGIASPGLKDIAASMGMDDEEMTLGQLLRLRKEAFNGGVGSGPQSARVSTSSNESSPTSQYNPSPLAGRSHAGSMGASFNAVNSQRRPSSEVELPQVQETPEGVESGEDSPISDHVVLGTARAVLCNSRVQQKRASAELLAQEYSSMLNANSPSFVIPEPTKHMSSGSSSELVQGQSSPPLIASPKPRHASVGLGPTSTPAIKASSPLSSPPVRNPDTPPQSYSVPSPPTVLMQRFAQRPAPDAYRKFGQPTQPAPSRHQNGTDNETPGASSVAYVRDVDVEDGVEKWFLERRQRKSTGELLVVGREPVESGSI